MKRKLLPALLLSLGLGFTATAQTFTTVSTFAGNSTAGLVDGALASAEFRSPYNICIDNATGYFYVADALNNCIRKIANGMVTTLAGNGVQGDVDGQGASARFNAPSGICYSGGYIYITDNGNHKIKRIDTLGNAVTFAGTGNAGSANGAALSAQFNNPVEVISDNNGGILVADYGNNCIRLISNGQVTTYAGVAGSGGDQLGTASTARFNRPTGICMDASGNLYIADQVNNKIKVVSSGMVSLVAGSGTNSSVDGTGSGASLSKPAYLDFDRYGNIIFTEWYTSKVRRVTPAGVVTTITGTGVAGYVDGPVNSAEFDSPYGFCVDANGDAYMTDKLNNVIRKVALGDVGIEESKAASLTFFPNPANDQLTIVNNSEFKLHTITIMDALGKVCKTISVSDQQTTISIAVSDLAAGQYFVIGDGEQSRYSGKFIRE